MAGTRAGASEACWALRSSALAAATPNPERPRRIPSKFISSVAEDVRYAFSIVAQPGAQDLPEKVLLLPLSHAVETPGDDLDADTALVPRLGIDRILGELAPQRLHDPRRQIVVIES